MGACVRRGWAARVGAVLLAGSLLAACATGERETRIPVPSTTTVQTQVVVVERGTSLRRRAGESLTFESQRRGPGEFATTPFDGAGEVRVTDLADADRISIDRGSGQPEIAYPGVGSRFLTLGLQGTIGVNGAPERAPVLAIDLEAGADAWNSTVDGSGENGAARGLFRHTIVLAVPIDDHPLLRVQEPADLSGAGGGTAHLYDLATGRRVARCGPATLQTCASMEQRHWAGQ